MRSFVWPLLMPMSAVSKSAMTWFAPDYHGHVGTSAALEGDAAAATSEIHHYAIILLRSAFDGGRS